MPGRLQSLRSAPPGCRGLREVTFERWTLTRSSYRNRIPRERSPPGRTCGLPGRPRLHARPQRGQSGADKRAPRRLGGGRRARVCAGPATGGDTAEGPLWEGRGRRLRPATPWLHGPPPAPLPRDPGRARDPRASRDRGRSARQSLTFPSWEKLT